MDILKIVIMCLCVTSCSFLENITKIKGEPDTRPMLQPNQIIDVSPRETGKYRCPNKYLMMCDVGAAWATCRCIQ